MSDEQAEYRINDRLSFKEFLGLSSGERVPDARTIRLFQDNLIKKELEEALFEEFHTHLDDLGLYVNEGKLIDASFVEVPKQRNSRFENALIKSGEIPENFTENLHRLAQKDTDARWTKKNEVSYFGYKNHAKGDAKSKIITDYTVTDASVHDSNETDKLLNENDKGEPFYADSAYGGEPQEAIIEEKGMVNQGCEKGVKSRPLTEEQRASNREKSRIHCRVKHIFRFKR